MHFFSVSIFSRDFLDDDEAKILREIKLAGFLRVMKVYSGLWKAYDCEKVFLRVIENKI